MRKNWDKKGNDRGGDKILVIILDKNVIKLRSQSTLQILEEGT